MGGSYRERTQVNEPTKPEVDAEDWLKATSVELCKVADYFLALRQNTMEVVSAATQVNIDAARLEEENTELKARVKRLEDELNDNGLVLQKLQDERDKAISLADRLWKALAAADKYIDEIQSNDHDYDTWIYNTADARTAYAFAKHAAKEPKL